MQTTALEADFDLDLDMESVDDAGFTMESKSFTGTGTCLSCPVTSWNC
ncbi:MULTISPECIES: hypothetical protein [Streptomyces]|nr:hypothetical protein [Streptomyces angustmyceticus]